MSAYTASQIETMALQFTRATSTALSFLELPSRTDGEIFEGLMDQVADNLPLSEAGWDLFASTARIAFFDNDAPMADRERWKGLVTKCRAIIDAEWLADEAAQIADFRHDARRDAAA